MVNRLQLIEEKKKLEIKKVQEPFKLLPNYGKQTVSKNYDIDRVECGNLVRLLIAFSQNVFNFIRNFNKEQEIRILWQ